LVPKGRGQKGWFIIPEGKFLPKTKASTRRLLGFERNIWGNPNYFLQLETWVGLIPLRLLWIGIWGLPWIGRNFPPIHN